MSPVIVTAAIIVSEGRVLICRRAPGEKLEGFWEFPGGKLEEGESLQACLERELQEELGVRCRAGDVLGCSTYDYKHGSIELVGLKTEVSEPVSAGFELSVHDRAEWVKPADLPGYLLAPADVPLAEKLQKIESGN